MKEKRKLEIYDFFLEYSLNIKPNVQQ